MLRVPRTLPAVLASLALCLGCDADVQGRGSSVTAPGIEAGALSDAPSGASSGTQAGTPSVAPSNPPPAAGAPLLSPAVAAIGERCLDCHAGHVHGYRATGMARTLGPIDPGELAGLQEVADGTTGWRYHFEQDERGARIVESWKAPGSDQAARVTQAAELEFAIGAGLLDRSYAARAGELLWFAPLEVIGTGSERRAVLAPGHVIAPGSRFGIPIAEECLACHTDALPPRDYPLNSVPRDWKPRGISCAACHQAGDEHAAWHESDLAGRPPAEPDPMRTPGVEGAIESVSACARCHLQGDASILLEPGARGLPRPGGDLLDRRAVFVAAEATNEIGFVSHVERMVLSRCFVESLGEPRELSCVTCHDPHRSSFDPEERAVVRAKCLECHPAGISPAEGKPAAPCDVPVANRGAMDCAQCHMRRTGVFDVAEVEIHDHFVRARPGPPSEPGPLRVKEALDAKLALFAWPEREPPAYAKDEGLWTIAFASYGRPDLALERAKRPPGKFSAPLATYHHVRGSLLERTERPLDALIAYEKALAIDPRQTESAVNLGALLGRFKRGPEGRRLLDLVIEEHPVAEGALRNRALIRIAAGDAAGFAEDLERAYRIRPQPALARALAQHWRGAGRTELAQRWEAELARIDPGEKQPPR